MRPRFGSSRSLALAASSLFGVAAAATYSAQNAAKNNARGKLPHDPWANVDKPLPNRSDMLREIAKKTSAFNNNEKKTKTKTKKKKDDDDDDDDENTTKDDDDDDDDGRFDVLVIGGGATGSGVALDAQTRGLNTIVVEREDFGSGTSSKSTKLVHGGVRYLEKAVFNLDYGQLKLVFEALKERKVLLHNAPHLSHVLMIATPCYEWYEVPYYWAGMKAYDIVAGMSALTFSSFATSSRTIMEFPTVAKRKVLIDDEEEARKIRERDDVDEILSTEEPTMGKSLKGSILYSDGQFDDARLNVALAVTAAHAGAVVLNHCSVVDLLRDEKNGEKITGAIVKDEETGKTHAVRAKVIVNCTGPFVDEVRALDDPSKASKEKKMVSPSLGAHVVLPKYYVPEKFGMIIPKTKDGRVVFLLPWLDRAIAGTTDIALEPGQKTPTAPLGSRDEVDYILETIAPYLALRPHRQEVLSVWSGARPLAKDPTKTNSSDVSRDHVIAKETPSDVIVVAGGKWTTYRLMAEETVDLVLKTMRENGENVNAVASCRTSNMGVIGAHGHKDSLSASVAQSGGDGFGGSNPDPDVSRHLATSYGDRAMAVASLASFAGLEKRLHPNVPVIEAEVIYAARAEFCRSASDFLARRSRMAFLDVQASEMAINRVVELLAKELNWGWRRRRAETKKTREFLKSFRAC